MMVDLEENYSDDNNRNWWDVSYGFHVYINKKGSQYLRFVKNTFDIDNINKTITFCIDIMLWLATKCKENKDSQYIATLNEDGEVIDIREIN